MMGLFRNIGALATGALACGPALAQADDPPLVMEPSSQWVADYAEDYCALRRAFAAEDQRAILELRQYAPGEGFEVVVFSDTLAATRTAPKVRFEPDEAWTEPELARHVEGGNQHGVVYDDTLRPLALRTGLTVAAALRMAGTRDGSRYVPPPVPEWPDSDRDARERALTALTIADSFSRDITLNTGRLHAPMQALRECIEELLTPWGLDPVAVRSIATPPKAIDLMGWAVRSQVNYPSEMIRQMKEAAVQLRLVVGPDGRPTLCLPRKGRVDPAFERSACDIAMRTVRFEPALDADGHPIASLFSTTIVYELSR